jgi:hypothetical protein
MAEIVLAAYLSERRPGEEVYFSEIRTVIACSDEQIRTTLQKLGLGEWAVCCVFNNACDAGDWLSKNGAFVTVKDNVAARVICESFDEDAQEMEQAKAEHGEFFSAVYEGKPRRIRQIVNVEQQARVDGATVELDDGETVWLAISDLNSAAQNHVRNIIAGIDENEDAEMESKDGENIQTVTPEKKGKKRKKKISVISDRRRNKQMKAARQVAKENAAVDEKEEQGEKEIGTRACLFLFSCIAHCVVSSEVDLGTAEDAQNILQYLLQRWTTEAETDEKGAQTFPTVPSAKLTAARVNDFLAMTSVAANTHKVCAVCGEFHLPDKVDVFHLAKRNRKGKGAEKDGKEEKVHGKTLGRLEKDLALLVNKSSRVPVPLPANPDAPGMELLKGLRIEYKGVDEAKQTITVCHRCQNEMEKTGKKPARSLANGLCFGPLIPEFQNLNIITWKLLQKYRLTYFIEKLHASDVVTSIDRPTFPVLRSHVNAFLQVHFDLATCASYVVVGRCLCKGACERELVSERREVPAASSQAARNVSSYLRWAQSAVAERHSVNGARRRQSGRACGVLQGSV